MAPSFIAALVPVIAGLLALAKIDVSAADLQTTLTVLVSIVGGIIVLLRQVQTGRATWFGSRPK
jgi:hypothetical protein